MAPRCNVSEVETAEATMFFSSAKWEKQKVLYTVLRIKWAIL